MKLHLVHATALILGALLFGVLLSTANGHADGHEPQVIRVSSSGLDGNVQLAALISEIRTQADAFVFLAGGASNMREDQQRQLLTMFDALSILAQSGRRIAVGDGGTKAGIMEAAGLARQASGNAFPLIGVPPASEIPPRGQTAVDPNHSHIVAVDNPVARPGDAWGPRRRPCTGFLANSPKADRRSRLSLTEVASR